jgi:enoyl-CoA hydratase/carnithine racemase
VESLAELEAELDAFVGDRGRWHGEVGENVRDDSQALAAFGNREEMSQTIEAWLADARLPALARAWVKGADVDWTRLYGDARPRRVSLPTYPFERRRFWITDIEAEMRTEGLQGVAPLSTVVQSPELPAGQPTLQKPSGIALREPCAFEAKRASAPEPLVRVEDHAGGVTIVRLSEPGDGSISTEQLVEQLGSSVRRAGGAESCRVVVVTGDPQRFLVGSSREHTIAAATLECPVPVVAAIRGRAEQAGLLLGALCDFPIWGDEASCVWSHSGTRASPGQREVICARFGPEVGRALVLWGRPYTGRELADACPGVRTCPNDAVEATAFELANQLAKAPRQALVALKAQLARPFVAAMRAESVAPIAGRDHNGAARPSHNLGTASSGTHE